MNIPEVKIIDSVSSGQINMDDIELMWVDNKLYKIVPLTPNKNGVYRPVLSGHKYSVSYGDTQLIKAVEEPEEEKEEEITMPETWRDKGNKLYVKGKLSNTWRVYYTDQDYEEIDEKEVEERYARNGENWYNVNWYDFKYQDFYYRYDNGKYTRKRVGYLIYEPIDRNKYLSAKAMRSL